MTVEGGPGGYQALEYACRTLLVGLVAVYGWAVLDRRSAAAARLRDLSARREARCVFVALLGVSVFGLAVADVLVGGSQEELIRLDRVVRATARDVARVPSVRAAAGAVSEITGGGLILVVGAIGLALAAAGRRRDALVIAVGGLGTWLLSALLKMAFAVPRPGAPRTRYLISGYGFPSAHTLVTVVACGLLVWALARDGPARTRTWLYAAALIVGAVAGASRIVLDAHWLSDVIAGVAAGAVVLSMVVLAVGRDRAGQT